MRLTFHRHYRARLGEGCRATDGRLAGRTSGLCRMSCAHPSAAPQNAAIRPLLRSVTEVSRGHAHVAPLRDHRPVFTPRRSRGPAGMPADSLDGPLGNFTGRRYLDFQSIRPGPIYRPRSSESVTHAILIVDALFTSAQRVKGRNAPETDRRSGHAVMRTGVPSGSAASRRMVASSTRRQPLDTASARTS